MSGPLIGLVDERTVDRHTHVHTPVHSQVHTPVHSQVHTPVHSQVHTQVHTEVHTQVHTNVDSIVDRGVSVPRGRAAVCSQGRTQPVNGPVQMSGGTQDRSQGVPHRTRCPCMCTPLWVALWTGV